MKISKAGSCIILVLSLVLFAGGVGCKKTQSFPKTPEEERAKMLENDLALLDKPGASIQEQFQILGRLAQMRHPRAQAEALKRVADPSSSVRATSASVLGFYSDPQSQAALLKLAQDSEPEVRGRALRGIGLTTQVQNLAWLKEALRGPISKDWTLANRAVALDGVCALSLKLAKNLNDKSAPEWSVKEALKVLENADSPVVMSLAKLFVECGPSYPKLRDQMRSYLSAKGELKVVDPIAVKTTAIYYLAKKGDPWLKTQFSPITKGIAPELIRAWLDVILLVCPDKRYEFLKKVVKEKLDRELALRALKVLNTMRSEEALQVVSEVLREGVAPEIRDAAQKVYDALSKLPKESRKDACLQVSQGSIPIKR